MKKTISRLLAVAVGLSSLVFGSCGQGSGVSDYDKNYPDRVVNSYSFDVIGGNDVMPIGLYYGPYTPNASKDGNVMPNFTDEYYVKMLADAGINLFTYCPESYPQARESIQKVLTLADKYNIGYYVNDYAVTSMTHGTTPLNGEKLKEQVAEFANHKSFVGFYSYDEPHYEKLGYIGQVNQFLNEEFDNRYSTYVNMLPKWEEHPLKYTDGTEDVSYEEYIGKYYREGYGKYISWDHYVWDFRSYKGYFNNLAIIKEMSEEYGIPYWAFIQAGGQWNDLAIEIESLPTPFPTEGQLIWNVNTALACGSKGIQYFLGFQPLHFAYAPNGTYDFTRNGFFGAVGNVNEWYYYAQKINAQIAAVDEILMNSYNVGVLPSASIKEDFEGNSMVVDGDEFHQLKGIRGDALVGCFEYEKRTVLYVVNYLHTKAQDIILDLNDAHSMKIIQRGKTYERKERHLGVHLEAGEGVLIEFI